MKDGQRTHVVTIEGHAIYAIKNSFADGQLIWVYAKGDGTDYTFATYEEAVAHIEANAEER